MLKRKQSEKGASQIYNAQNPESSGSYAGTSYSNQEEKIDCTVEQVMPYELSPERRPAELEGETDRRLWNSI